MKPTTTTARKYVAYYRVSTAKQGASGLGLEAQKAGVLAFTQCSDCIAAEFVEVESGKKNNRAELIKAIEYARANGCILVVAKLDRLSRNAAFLFTLRDSGVQFVCADMPDANTLTIGIFATLAQYERELISERTVKALAAKKAQGAKLGTPANLTDAGRAKSVETNKAKAAANENTRRARAFAESLKAAGLNWSAIAEKLNAAGFQTARGGLFQAVQVQRLFS